MLEAEERYFRPDMPVAEAVRISMSIPLFFTAKKRVHPQMGFRCVYVDGGVLNNFPVKLFDRKKYVVDLQKFCEVDYYQAVNKNSGGNPYVYNKETLGFRLDSKSEIAVFDEGMPPHNKIRNIAKQYRDFDIAIKMIWFRIKDKDFARTLRH